MTNDSTLAPAVPKPITRPLERVCVLIVNYNSGPWLTNCIRALRGNGAQLPAIQVLDNASDDSSALDLNNIPGLEAILSRQNIGFGAGINTLAQNVTHEFILVLNPDCLIVQNGLKRLIEELDAFPSAAMCSGRVFDMSGNEQRGSRRMLPTPRRLLKEMFRLNVGEGIDLTRMPPPQSNCEVEAVSGACMLIRRDCFNELGGFDLDFPMHFEDLDLMARLAHAGHAIRLVPEVAISHAGGVSSRHRRFKVQLDKHRGLWRYLNKHCRDQWPVWSRPLWAGAISVHFLLAVALSPWRR